MRCLFVINKQQSKRTARYWRRHRQLILRLLPNSEEYFPRFSEGSPEIALEKFETIIFVGNDSFFNRIINVFYPLLTEHFGRHILAFIPDSFNSALAEGFGLPSSLSKQVELIRCQQSIPMDVIRCHYLDPHGFPTNRLILNDATIGLPPLTVPDFLKNTLKRIRTLSPFHRHNSPKKITLVCEGQTLFEGQYTCACILLGRKVTHGPRISAKTRLNLQHFEYLQLNSRSLGRMTAKLPELLSGNFDHADDTLFYKKLSSLEIKGIGEGNRIIADGLLLGRLPATFTLLPKAMRVISPLAVVKSAKPRLAPLTPEITTPIINRYHRDIGRFPHQSGHESHSIAES
jgi:diacylglycerol kinase family enzyme